jgi:hypothetical protein
MVIVAFASSAWWAIAAAFAGQGEDRGNQAVHFADRRLDEAQGLVELPSELLVRVGQRGLVRWGVGACGDGLRRREPCEPLKNAAPQLLQLAGKTHDVDQRRAQVVADDVGEALDFLVRLAQIRGALIDRGLEVDVHVAQLPFGLVAHFLRAPHQQDGHDGQRQYRGRAGGGRNRRQDLRPVRFRRAMLQEMLLLVAHGVAKIADARGGSPCRILLHDLVGFRLLAAHGEADDGVELP